MINSGIQWCDDTVNVVEGCSEVDTDCEHCYAKGIAARFSTPAEDGGLIGATPGKAAGHYYGLAKRSATRGLPQWTGKVRCRLDVLDAMFWRLERAKEPRRQFLCSMGDIFHREVPDAFIDDVFARIAILEQHAWKHPHPFLMLTKRPDRAAKYTNEVGVEGRIQQAMWTFVQKERAMNRRKHAFLGLNDGAFLPCWPLRSVVLITSAGTQDGANNRVPDLLRAKAAHRGVSCEPMTGWVDFTPWLVRLDWIILGGESGHGARPCKIEWLETVVADAYPRVAKVFVKQLGNVLATELGRHGKGGELEDLPESIRVREHVSIQ